MRPSLENLLTWLRAAPRTLDWNAIIAYDRTRTNTVLLQEYIARFSTTSYFPPFEGKVPTTSNEIEWVYDYLVDAPRLSFENSVITAPRAKLTMNVLGGAQVSIANEPGRSAAVIRVASFDALQGPKYTVDIDLLVAQGSVDSAGRVQLDLGTGTNPLLYFGPTANQRSKGGEFLKSELAGLAPEIKVFVLNEMGSQDGQFLQPESFRLATHAEPGAKVARAANFGEGAVLLFVTMKGETNGTLPASDKDMQFLIPEGDYSAAILLGQRFLLRKIFFEGLRKLAAGSQVTCSLTGPAQGFAEGVAAQGTRRVTGITPPLTSHFSKAVLNYVDMPLGDDFDLTLDRTNESVSISWEGVSESSAEIQPVGSREYRETVSMSWRVVQAFRFQLQTDSGELKLVAIDDGKVRQLKLSPGGYTQEPEVYEHFAELAETFETWFASDIDQAFAQFASAVEEIDIFRLNSLLFRGSNIVHFNEARAQGDLSLFGELAPDLTEFVITPLEPKVGPGATLQFRTEPVVPGVTWGVQNIPGITGAPGSIDTNGLYTAPTKAQLEGLFVRVRVTATLGQYSSSALVTVLVRDIVINPFVQVCGASIGGVTQSRELAAGSLSGTALTWKVVGNTGSSVVPSTVEGGDHTFVARDKDPAQTVTLDEVAVTDAAGKTDSSWVLVVHQPPNAEIKIEQSAPDKAQLLMDLGLGPIPPEDGIGLGLKWTVLKGGGTIDEKGVYQADSTSPFRFALVTADLPGPSPQFPPYTGFIILPLPLIELPTLLSALERSDAYFKAVPVVGAEAAAKLLTPGA